MQPARPSTELLFPVGGLDVSTSFEQQPPQSTPIGVNVRGFEPATQRLKGGARPGIAKFVTPRLPSGAHAVQCLDAVTWFSTSALLDTVAVDDSNGNGTDDPSTGSRNPGRTVRTGGSGRQPSRHGGNQTQRIHFVQKKSASVTDAGSSAGPSFNVPFTNPVSAGSLLLVTGQIHGNLGVGGVTDSLGNAYSPLFTIGVSGVAKLWYAISLAGGPCTVTYNLGAFTVSTSATTGVALEYSGVTTGGPLDGSSQNSNFISAAALWTTGSVTALGTKELMIGVFTSFYFPLPWGDFTPGVDQNPGNHTSFTLRSEDKVADPATIGEFFAIRVIDFIGAGINPSGSQEITATGSDPSGGDSYEAVGASFQPA